MRCPFCSAADTKVIDSRLVADADQVRRRRECLSCAERFTTYETAELLLPRNNLDNDAARLLVRSPYLTRLTRLEIKEGNDLRGDTWAALLERFGEDVVS